VQSWLTCVTSGWLLQATGWLHKADVKTALAGFFKGKSVSHSLRPHDSVDTLSVDVAEALPNSHVNRLFTHPFRTL
jgi:hypothetical protein